MQTGYWGENDYGENMGAIFAFGFALIIGFVGLILLVVGIKLWKKVKIASIISFVFSGICFLPILFFVFIISFSIIEQHKMKNDYIKENGKLFAEIVYGDKKTIYKEVVKSSDLNVVNKNGETPLYIMATRGIDYFPIIKKMVEKGADPNFADESGRIPLHAAASNGSSDIEIIKYLTDKGSDINKQDKYGYTPLMLCVEKSKYTGKDAVQIVNFLISKGCNTKLKNDKNEDSIDIIMRLMKEEEDWCKDYPDLDYQESKNYIVYKKLLEILKEA